MKKTLTLFSLLIVIIIGIFIVVKNNKNLPQQKLVKYQKFLSKLPLDNPKSIIKGEKEYFKYFSLSDPIQERDYAFKYYFIFYWKVVNKIGEKFASKGILDRKFDKESLEKNVNYYESCGIKLLASEGTVYPSGDYTFLHKNFDEYISNEWREYLYFLLKESEEGFTDDAVIIIPWDKMRERIITLESFIDKNPEFAEKDEIQNAIKMYLYSYLMGTDNSPIYFENSYNGDTFLDPEIKKSYELFIDTNKDSKYYPIILEYYNLLKKHNFNVENYVQDKSYIRDFIKQKGLDIADTPED